jgi:S-adenosylmethionine hydrolase
LKGIPSGNFGDEITDYVKLNVPVTKSTEGRIEGHVVHIDRFGNLITNIAYKDLQSLVTDGAQAGAVVVTVGSKEIQGLKKFYAEAAQGEPGALINSDGFLEIFLFRQNARTTLSVKRGEVVSVSLPRPA